MQTHQSIELITEAMTERGFTCRKVRANDQGYRIFTKGSDIWATPYRYVYYPFISPTLRLLSLHKDIAYEYVRTAGHSVPQTVECRRGEVISSQALTFEYPVVVKPANGSGSANVSRNVQDEQALIGAVQQVHQAGCDALVQRQFAGKEIRLTVLGGAVVSTCLRAVPLLEGDGKRTIAALLAAENQARSELSLPYIVYPQLTASLVTLPDDMQQIPGPGELVTLSASTMISGGASVYNVADTVHNSYKDIATDLARKLHASFLVIDLLVTDYTQSAAETNHVFLEFNTSPALKLYYSFRDGKQFDILPLLASKIEEQIRGSE